jgi:cell division protein FtsQ
LRRATLALATASILLSGLFVLWRAGEWLLRCFLYENPTFAIRSLQVHTDGVLAPEQLLLWAGVREQQNLFALDIARVKRDLEMVPFIASASVERILPHTLRIRVSEREPVAQVVFPQRAAETTQRGVYHLDAKGFVMLPVEAHQRARPETTNTALPLLTGLSGRALRLGRPVDSAQVQAALQLAVAFSHSPLAGVVELREIDLGAADILQVRTGQSEEVVFGPTDLDRQLRRWRAVRDYAQRTSRSLAWMDLSVSNNVPARWVIPASAPAMPPQNLNPIPAKKKHV